MAASDENRLSTRDMASPRDRADERSGVSAQTGSGGASPEAREEPLLHPSDLEDFRERWETIQTGFVDEPRRAVGEADELVAETMQKLADTFSRERSALEDQWAQGDDVSTEDLRVSLQRYRSFFNRLLRA